MIFIAVVVVHFQSKVETPFDSGWSIQVASSLIHEGNVDLDEFAPRASADDYRIVEVDGRLLPRYPIAPSLAVLPAYLMTRSVVKASVGFSLDRYYIAGGPTGGMERWLSSLLVGLCAVLVYRLARRELGLGDSLLVSGVFAFATSAWSVVSRALWQHSPSMVCTVLALLALTGESRRKYALAGSALAVGYTMRPTNALLLVAVAVLLGWRERRQLPTFLVGVGIVAVPFVVFNYLTWHLALPQYFLLGDGNALRFGNWGEGLAGTLISPGRGLFVYSPVLLFCLAGVALRLRRPAERDLTLTLTAAVIAHWLMISVWFAWWGGEVFGPRLFADLLPVAMYFLIPVVGAFDRNARRHRALAACFVLMLTWSVWVHLRGATDWATWDWNIEPVSVDRHPERLWDWHDPPFWRFTSLHHPEDPP